MLDYQMTLRERMEEMWVGLGMIVEEGIWGGFAGKVAVWPPRGEGKSNEMRQERWRGKRDQGMDDRQERQMSRLTVHMNDSVRPRLPSTVMTGSLVRWDYHHLAVHWNSQLWRIHHFEFAVHELRAPAASSFEDASTCALVLWVPETATWSALCASWLRSGCFRSLVPSRKRSKPASPPGTQAPVSEL